MELIDKGDNYNYCRLRFIYRYIDDLISLNDKGLFNQIFKDIYPDMLELNSTNITQNSTNYLDMNINICNDKFEYELYDKRNDYNFQVISLPNLNSNIPISSAYSVIYSQVLRYFKATNGMRQFMGSLDRLRNKMIRQNFLRSGIEKQFNKFVVYNKYDIIAKFWEIPNVNKIS